MSAVPIGDNLEGDRRNPWGWITFFALAGFMVLMQLSAYLSRTPNVEILRARVIDQLQTDIAFRSLSPTLGNDKTFQDTLEKDAQELRTKIAGDPETTLLYAAVRTEQDKPVSALELTPLRFSKDPVYKAGYQIYSSPSLTVDQAHALTTEIPKKKFLYRLVAAQAFKKAKDPGPYNALGTQSASFAKVGILGFGCCLFFVSIALIIGYASYRSTGHVAPKGFALGNLSPPDADRVAIRAAQIFTAFLLVSLVGSIVLAKVDKNFAELPVYLAIIGAIVWLFRKPVNGKWITLQSIGINFQENLGKHVLWGVGGAIANLPIVFGIQALSMQLFKNLPQPEHPVTIELTDAASPLVILQLLVVASICAPFIEEIMFRGTLFPALASALKSPLWGGVLSSFIFAAIHPTGIPAWPALAAIGGMSCFLSYQTRSLVPSMVMHGVHNLGTLVFTLILLR